MHQSKVTQIKSSSTMTDLSIIIVNYKCLDYLRKCIRSIIDTINQIRYEIVIVDNQSADGTPEAICKEFPGLRMIENTQNLGVAKGNNQGVLASKGKFILLLNNDTEALPGSIETLFKIISQSPEVGLLGCRLIHPDLTIQQSFGRMLNPVIQFGQKLFTNKIYENSANPIAKFLLTKWYSVERDVDWVRGACMMIRREALDQTCLMDEHFFMFFEDVDISTQIRNAGWKVRFTPKASIIHHEGVSVSENFFKSALEYRRSQLYFYEKYYGRLGLAGLKVFLLCKYFKNLFISWFVRKVSLIFGGRGEENDLAKFNREILNLIRNYR